jgi:hypothetical protein
VNRVHKAFERLGDHFAEQASRQAFLARQLAGRESPDDAKLAEILGNERRAATRADGSIGGSLAATAWGAWEMMDLGSDWLHGGLDRLVSWVQNQIERDGATDPAPVTLPSGARFVEPEQAAFAVRCLALRTLVRARRGDRPGVAKLMDDVAVAKGRQPQTLDLSASALSGLALAPPVHRHHLDGLVTRIGRAQRDEGDWPDADLFHMLDALILAGIRPARGLVARAAPALLALQRDHGAFDDPPHEERALIGMRALHIALED